MGDVTFQQDRGGRDLVFQIDGDVFRMGAASTRCFRDIELQFSAADALATAASAVSLMHEVRRRWPQVRGPQVKDEERELLGEALLLAGGVEPDDAEELCRDGNYRGNPRATFDLRRYGFRPPTHDEGPLDVAPKPPPKRTSDQRAAQRSGTETVVTVEDIDIENQAKLFVERRSPSEGKQATRSEHALVKEFQCYLERAGDIVGSKAIRVPGEGRFPVDLYNASRRQLIEAKDAPTREKVRMALGQLIDYGRYVDHDRRAVLVPRPPSADLQALLKSQKIYAVWRDGTGFADNAEGAFV
jgi:hypothetical protein